MEDHRKLAEARYHKGWSQEKVAEAIGVTRSTLSQWERGVQKPQEFYVHRLCTFYEMTRTELGMEESVHRKLQKTVMEPEREKPTFQDISSPSVFIATSPASKHFLLPTAIALPERQVETPSFPDCASLFGIKLAEMVTLVHQWGDMTMFSYELQSQLDQEIKSLDRLKDQYPIEAFSLSRRSFLVALASLPAALLVSSKQGHKTVLSLEELLPQCAASLTACWHLSSGSHLDSIAQLLDSFLPTLIMVVKNAPSYRELAADLVAQCYFLKTILAWHTEGLERAESFCIQALRYSEIAKNINLRLNALNQHALISYYAQQFPKALAKSEEAASLLRHESHEHIFPIVRGRVYMYLAAIQASNQKEHAERTLEHAKRAFALQAMVTEPVPLYADCGDAPLTLWDGLTYYHLSFRDVAYAQRALTSLKTFGHLQPDTALPERFRLECLNNRILAATQCNEMEEAILCWEMGKQGARTLESKQREKEADFAYQALLRRWPSETKRLHLAHDRVQREER